MYLTLKDNTRIYLEVTGSGAPLVLLHGNAENTRYFKRQIPLFEQYFTVITLDFRGHGKSSNGIHPLSFELFASDLKEIVDLLGIKQFHLLGFSDGANVAMIFASKFPKYVNKLILNAGNLSADGLLFISRIATELAIILAYLCFWKRDLVEIRKLMRQSVKLSWQDLTKISAKTLVLVGAFDMIKPSHSKKLTQAIPNARLIVIPFALHDIARIRSKRFNQVVLDFLITQNT
ncbi:MAG: alpha/beta hydrolase [Streptococcaceae bacterium]|jgi:pimeloyl-ACP methyl ester carboxylesterase|nr:alpha/beta hydrolase [Streptococcaceae bacterium]